MSAMLLVKRYEARRAGRYSTTLFAVGLGCFVFACFVLAIAFVDLDSVRGSLLWVVAFAGCGFLLAWRSFTIPRLIEWHDENTIIFRWPRGSATLKSSDIRELRWTRQCIELTHARGSLTLNRDYNDFSEFLMLLRKHNPRVTISGLRAPIEWT